MIEVTRDGLLVDVWVVPRAARDEVVGIHDGALRVRTSQPPERGSANRRVADLVAAALGGSSATVATGIRSRRKRILVVGVEASEAERRLAGLGS